MGGEGDRDSLVAGPAVAAPRGGGRGGSVPKSCPTLCDPRHCRPPGSPVLAILQARILEWVAFPFSRGSS